MSEDIALALGSNQGDRRANLKSAVAALKTTGFLDEIRCSPVLETAAFLKPGSPIEWDQPFLNIVVAGRTTMTPDEALRVCQSIELAAGRGPHETWSPRTLDIDILAWGQAEIQTLGLTIPHREIARRSFVLDPWVSLQPSRRLRRDGETILELRRRNRLRQPLLMEILNVTPDSFSDGGEAFCEKALYERIEKIRRAPPAILDIGGQSTRPGAEVVDLEEEWRRLERSLRVLNEFSDFRETAVRPWISIDTFRSEIAERALEWGVDVINDVSGLADPAMMRLAREARTTQFIFMHHLGIPADRHRHLPRETDPVEEVLQFAQTRLRELVDQGIAPERLVFDPGIGFGKIASHSISLIKRADEIVSRLPIRVLFGHSRKSYQRQIDPSPDADRDAITLLHSLHLADAGVEFLRVHDASAHRSALLARDHFSLVQ